jgi:hypothetical protein
MCAVRSADEYVRLGGFVHVNSAENYFSIFKRGVIGTFHHISEQHLDRYLAEFDCLFFGIQTFVFRRREA